MGGDREAVVQDDGGQEATVVQSRKKKKTKLEDDGTGNLKVSDLKTQKIRFHENKGEVHFHDDDNSLKAAVPVTTWFTAMNQIRQLKKWSYLDAANKTLLRVKPDKGGKRVDVVISVRPANVGATLKALSDFSKRG